MERANIPHYPKTWRSIPHYNGSGAARQGQSDEFGDLMRKKSLRSRAFRLLDKGSALCYSTAQNEKRRTKRLTSTGGVLKKIFRSAPLAKSRNDQLAERLRDLQISSPDVEAAAVVSVDGLSMASSLPGNIEEDRVSAMSAAMLSLGERISSELGRGTLDQVYVKGERGFVILMNIGEEAVLTVLAREQAKLGLIFLDMSRAVKELEKLV
jgi:hypothetical protein